MPLCFYTLRKTPPQVGSCFDSYAESRAKNSLGYTLFTLYAFVTLKASVVCRCPVTDEGKISIIVNSLKLSNRASFFFFVVFFVLLFLYSLRPRRDHRSRGMYTHLNLSTVFIFNRVFPPFEAVNLYGPGS